MITLLIRAGHANGVKNPPVRERAGPESNPGWHGSGSSSEGLTPQNAAACLSRSSLRAWLGSIPPRSSRGPLPCAWPWRASWRAIAAQRQRLAAPLEAVVQSPAMRATPDELQQVEPIAIGESLARTALMVASGVRTRCVFLLQPRWAVYFCSLSCENIYSLLTTPLPGGAPPGRRGGQSYGYLPHRYRPDALATWTTMGRSRPCCRMSHLPGQSLACFLGSG